MTNKIRQFTLDSLPSLTDKQKEEIAKLAQKPDNMIDTSDAPELSDGHWANSVRGKFYKPTKQSVTTRIDSDVLDWIKSSGKGYQSRINSILRGFMISYISSENNASEMSEKLDIYKFKYFFKEKEYIHKDIKIRSVYKIEFREKEESEITEKFLSEEKARFTAPLSQY